MSEHDPTFLGTISAVSGASLTVRLSSSLASGLAIIQGHTYRVGHVGSFVRIPQGYQDLYGIVCEVGLLLPLQAPMSLNLMPVVGCVLSLLGKLLAIRLSEA